MGDVAVEEESTIDVAVEEESTIVTEEGATDPVMAVESHNDEVSEDVEIEESEDIVLAESTILAEEKENEADLVVTERAILAGESTIVTEEGTTDPVLAAESHNDDVPENAVNEESEDVVLAESTILAKENKADLVVTECTILEGETASLNHDPIMASDFFEENKVGDKNELSLIEEEEAKETPPSGDKEAHTDKLSENCVVENAEGTADEGTHTNGESGAMVEELTNKERHAENINEEKMEPMEVATDSPKSYIQEVKSRFINEPKKYIEFLKIMGTYQKELNKVDGDIIEKIEFIFRPGNEDLLSRFRSFIPGSEVPV